MARTILGSLLDRDFRNNLNGMLLELYEGINTATGTKNKIDAFIDGTGVVTRKMIANTSVDTTKIADGAVNNSKIADGSVTNSKLGNSSVNTDKIENEAVTHFKLGTNSVRNEKIADGAVDELKIADGSISSGKVKDGAILNSKYATRSITWDKLDEGAVTSSRLADGAVDEVKISDDSVTNSKIQNGAVLGSKIADGAVARKHIINNAVGTLQIADDTISKEKMKANSVDHTKLSVDSVMMNKGKDYPLKSVKLGDTAPDNIKSIVKNAVLDAKIYGAKLNMYYRLSFIANGYTSLGSSRYGISLEEVRATTGVVEKIIFSYNQEDREGNYQNATIRRGGDVDTIIVENGKYVASITVDRAVISASSSPEFINLSSGVGLSPTAIIDPVNYSYSNVTEDALTINRGKDYPLKIVNLNDSSATTIAALTKNAILDTKVFGAEIGKYYRLSTIGNGRESNGKKRYGITVEQRNMSDGAFEKLLFVYNDDNRPGNEQNANIQKLSETIDTITVDNGEIAVSVTVDRMVITNSTTPDLLNLSSGPGVSNSAVIDPSNYSF